MKRISLLLFIIICLQLALNAQNLADQLNTQIQASEFKDIFTAKYDRFKRFTGLNGMMPFDEAKKAVESKTYGVRLSLISVIPEDNNIKARDGGRLLLFCLQFPDYFYRFDDDDSIIFLAGNNRLEIPFFSKRSSIERYKINQDVCWQATSKQLMQITDLPAPEAKIGPLEVTLSNKTTKALRFFASLLEQN